MIVNGYMYRDFPPDFTLFECINYLEREILMASIRYYEFNHSRLSDAQYDGACKQLVDCMNRDREAFDKSQYAYVFRDFDGTTGFDLQDRLTPEDKEYILKIIYAAGGIFNNHERTNRILGTNHRRQ